MNLDVINYSAYEYADQTLAEFNRITHPLHHLGINHFGYFRIFDNGKYLMLGSNIELIKVYLSQISHSDEVFNKHILLTYKLKKHTFMLQPDFNFINSSNNPILDLISKYNIRHQFHICRKKDDHSIEGFLFSITSTEQQMFQFYIDNFNLLEEFVDYFVQAASHIIYPEEQKHLACYDQTFNFKNLNTNSNYQNNVMNFLKSIRVDNLISRQNTYSFPCHTQPAQNLLALSKRELECLFHLSAGKTAKQTAQILNLKFRTVERYIDSVRLKTGCHRKGELANLMPINKL